MVALKLLVWYIPKFYSLKFQYFSSIWEYNTLILLIESMIKIRYKIVGFSVNLGFWGSIQTLQCARAEATMLSIQCFGLDFCFDSPTWADFEDCQLGSPLTYRVLWYLFWKFWFVYVWIIKWKFHSISLKPAISYSK